MSSGYTKLFGSIVHSTIWRAPDHIRLVWITMLALANRDGIVEASVPGLADAARVTLQQCDDALKTLMSPDPYSRTKDHEGRRIAPAMGGWELLNYGIYREKMSRDQIREQARLRKRRQRARQKQSGVTTGHSESPMSRQAEAEAEAEAEARVPTVPIPPAGGVGEIWTHFCEARARVNPEARSLKLTAARRRQIAALLGDYPPAELRAATDKLFDPAYVWAAKGYTMPENVFSSVEQLEKVLNAPPQREGGNGRPAGPAPYHRPWVPPPELGPLIRDIGKGGGHER